MKKPKREKPEVVYGYAPKIDGQILPYFYATAHFDRAPTWDKKYKFVRVKLVEVK